MRSIIELFTVLYALAFSLLANAFILFDRPVLILFLIIAFIVLNIACGMKMSGCKSLRLRFLCHGSVLLIAFFASMIASAVLHFLALFGVIECTREMLITSVICCIIFNAIIFWNGIISVYLTSSQLGIKIRVAGAVCGLIPILNLIMLGEIISKVYPELLLESKREKRNLNRKDEQICRTKYPILFVHGFFFRDSKYLNYWGRIPRELELNGATCFYGEHHSAESVKKCGEELAERINQLVRETGCEKVNIIAHSKGGLDCRYAIANCSVADKIASLTTINTPHRGCVFADWLLEKAPEQLKEKLADSYNSAAKLLGDSHPDFMAAVNDLAAEKCRKFDSETPMPENIYCRSVGSVMECGSNGRFPLNYSYLFVKLFDGKNDGLVGEESFKWGDNYMLLELKSYRGISHGDVIDLNRENIKGFDVREFYVGLVSELKDKGL